MNVPNRIKISIVVPVYNVEPFIKQCLDSLIKQTLKEIEIILVDDCSLDKSGLICDKYAAIDNRVIVIHNDKNIKQGPSSNIGIEVAKGEYIGFVDPDDWVDLDFFEKLYNSAKRNNSDIAKTKRIKVLSDGNREKQTAINRKIKKGLINRWPIFMLYTNEHTTAIFKREVIIKNEVRYPDIRNAQDNVFLLYVTYFSNSISIISGTYYYYRQHPNSAAAVKEKPYYDSMLQYFQLIINFINNHEMEKYHYNALFLKSFNTIKNRYKDLNSSTGLEAYREEFITETLKIINQYKYDKQYILDSFFYGLTYRNKTQQFNRTNLYKVIKSISVLPSKIKSIFK